MKPGIKYFKNFVDLHLFTPVVCLAVFILGRSVTTLSDSFLVLGNPLCKSDEASLSELVLVLESLVSE